MKRFVLTAVLALGLIACGGGTSSTSSSTAATSGTRSGGPTAATSVPGRHTFPLMAENGSATAGTVVIQASQSSFTVTVSATGLPPSSAHTANIHEGQCASPGPTLYPLKDVVADASGKASITTSVQTPFAPTGRGWYVDVFTTAAGTRRLACANLPAA